MLDGADDIVERDPTHPLFAAAHTSTNSESERRQHFCERAAIFTENDPKARINDANSPLGRLLGCSFPFHTYVGEKVITGRTLFRQQLIAAITVIAYR